MHYSRFALYSLVLVIALLFFTIGGVMMGYVVGARSQLAQFRAHFTMLEDRGYLPKISDDLRDIRGTITRIEGNVLTVRVEGLDSINPFRSRGPRVRQVTIASSTTLIRNVLKEAAVLALQRQDPNAKQLSPYNPEAMTVKDLKVTDQVHIITDTNIIYSSSFTATRIEYDMPIGR